MLVGMSWWCCCPSADAPQEYYEVIERASPLHAMPLPSSRALYSSLMPAGPSLLRMVSLPATSTGRRRTYACPLTDLLLDSTGLPVSYSQLRQLAADPDVTDRSGCMLSATERCANIMAGLL